MRNETLEYSSHPVPLEAEVSVEVLVRSTEGLVRLRFSRDLSPDSFRAEPKLEIRGLAARDGDHPHAGWQERVSLRSALRSLREDIDLIIKEIGE